MTYKYSANHMAGRLQPNKGVPQSLDGEEHFGDLYIVEKEWIYHHKYNQFSPLTNHHTMGLSTSNSNLL